MRTVLVLALFSLLTACQAAPPELTEADRQAIAAEISQAAAASMVPFAQPQDLETALGFYVEDAGDYFVGEAATGVFNLTTYGSSQELRDRLGRLVDNRLGTTIEITDDRVAVLSADHAIQVLAANYAITNLEGETRTGYRMINTNVWVRENGAWKVLHFHQSFQAPTE